MVWIKSYDKPEDVKWLTLLSAWWFRSNDQRKLDSDEIMDILLYWFSFKIIDHKIENYPRQLIRPLKILCFEEINTYNWTFYSAWAAPSLFPFLHILMLYFWRFVVAVTLSLYLSSFGSSMFWYISETAPFIYWLKRRLEIWE